jgi:glucose uptake protein
MSFAFPLFDRSRATEIGVGPYALGLLMALGVVGCTSVASIFLMNLPVEGEPAEISEFFTGKFRNHIVGWIAGLLWGSGTMAIFAVNGAMKEGQFGLNGGFSYYLAVPFVGGLCGVALWKEFAGSRSKGKVVLALLLAAAAGALLTAGSVMGRR